MIDIERVFNPNKGLVQVENLRGMIFSSEGYAHRFIIRKEVRLEETGETVPSGFINGSTATARFIRADGVTVYLNGDVTGGVIYLILPPSCYGVPGSFMLTIYNTFESDTTCVYAAIGSDTESESRNAELPSEHEETLEQKVNRVLGNAFIAALFARNIGEIEGEIDTFQTTVNGIVQALAAANVRALNGPNMFKYQPAGVSVYVPSGSVITETITIPIEDATAAAATLTYTITNENITAGMVLHGIKSGNTSVVYWSMVTGTASDGSMSVSVSARSGAHDAAVTVTLYICAQTTAVLPYGEEARYYASSQPWINSISNPNYTGDPGEEIYERMVTLTGSDIVTEEDGASYNTAVAFTVQNASASGQNNADYLVFNHGIDGGTYERDGQTINYGPMGILDMIDGEKYTLSCWVRITSGTDARLFFGYGQSSSGYTPYADGNVNRYYLDVSGSTWQRVYWTFTYHASINNVTLHKRVAVGVCRYANGTVQLCGFRLVKGGLMGDNTVDTLTIDVREAMANIAPVESDSKASTAYASGALIVWKGQLCKTSAAVASGDTWAIGTNLTRTTLAAELAALS